MCESIRPGQDHLAAEVDPLGFGTRQSLSTESTLVTDGGDSVLLEEAIAFATRNCLSTSDDLGVMEDDVRLGGDLAAGGRENESEKYLHQPTVHQLSPSQRVPVTAESP